MSLFDVFRINEPGSRPKRKIGMIGSYSNLVDVFGTVSPLGPLTSPAPDGPAPIGEQNPLGADISGTDRAGAAPEGGIDPIPSILDEIESGVSGSGDGSVQHCMTVDQLNYHLQDDHPGADPGDESGLGKKCKCPSPCAQ